MEKAYENVIYYKCGCDSKVHALSQGEQETKEVANVENHICLECKEKIKVKGIERLNIEKVSKEEGSSKIKSKELVSGTIG